VQPNSQFCLRELRNGGPNESVLSGSGAQAKFLAGVLSALARQLTS
jgi:hypothetical protein